MNAPRFWYSRSSILPRIALFPASIAYRFGGWLRRCLARPYRAKACVLCVGNVTMGGAGKTPVVIALAQAAARLGIRVAAVSRGYGGALAGPVRVDPAHHGAADVGDEPLLIAAHVPTWISKNRAHGVRAADDDGVDLILLDDGFQNPTVVKDFSILVFDGPTGLGNGAVFPAGPLREPLESALDRTDIGVVIGKDSWDLGAGRLKSLTVHSADLAPVQTAADHDAGRYFAFAGIGIPEKFFATLERLNLNLVERRGYPDHHQYTDRDMNEILDAAARLGAQAITTRKDVVRIPSRFADSIDVLDVDLVFETSDTPETLVKEAMGHG